MRCRRHSPTGELCLVPADGFAIPLLFATALVERVVIFVIRLLRSVFPGCGPRLACLTACQAMGAAAEAAIVALMVPLLASVGAATTDAPMLRLGTHDPLRLAFPSLLMVLGGAFVVRAAFQASAVYLWAAGVERFETWHRERLLSGLLRANHACQSNEPAGRLQHLLTYHAESVARSYTALAWGGAHLVQVACLSFCAWFVSPIPSLVTAAALVSIVALLRPLTKFGSAAAKRRAEALGGYVHLIGQSLALLKELRIFGATGRYLNRAGRASALIARERRKQNVVGSLLPTLYQTAAGFLLLVGAVLIYFGDAIAGTGPVVSLLLLLRATAAAQHLHVTYHQLQDSRPALEELTALEQCYLDAEVPSGGVPLASIERLELRGVDFAYEGGRGILSDVDLYAERGDVVGIVGASGAGKSTLNQIILGLRSPGGGHLLINGKPAELFRTADLHARSAYVAQEPVMFNETIADCIRFGRAEFSVAELTAAAAAIGLLEEIRRMPRGFDTLVGDRGSLLSVGQRQRLSIARALVGDPDLLVFDEPTAALDTANEERIVARLEALRGRAITFVVTHRPALLRACNKVFEVAGGRVSAVHKQAGEAQEGDFVSVAG